MTTNAFGIGIIWGEKRLQRLPHYPLMHIAVTLHELMPKQWVAMLLDRLLDGTPISRIQRAIDQWE
jgi:hypothetical protein